MSHDSLPQFLAKVDLFGGLSRETLDDLMERGTTMTFAAGRHVIEQGTDDAGLQVVLEGSAEARVNDVARATFGPGDYFGELSLIDGKPRSATVVAGPDGLTTFALSALSFEPVLRGNPDVSQALLKAVTARLRALDEQG